MAGARVVSGGADVRGQAVDPSSLAEGTAVAATVGGRTWRGRLRRRGDGFAVEDTAEVEHPLPDGTAVAPLTRVGPAREGTVPGAEPGEWVTGDDGVMSAQVPGEWTASIAPMGEDGAVWRASTRGGTAQVGHAESVEAAQQAVAERVRRAAPATGRGATAPKAPQAPPEPVNGQGSEWVSASDLSIGDLARVTGQAPSGPSGTFAGHVVGSAPVLVERAGRPEPMMAVTLAEQPDGQEGWRGTVLVPLDSLAARAVGGERQQSASALDVLRGRLPGQLPTDRDGNGLFPMSMVTEVGTDRRVVTAARRGVVTVAWDGEGSSEHSGASLAVGDGGIARPPGWTRSGARIAPGMVVEWEDRRRGGRGIVDTVDGDTVMVSGPDGPRQVGARQVTRVGAVPVTRPGDRPVNPGDTVIEDVPVTRLADGDMVLLPGVDGHFPATVTGVSDGGGIRVVDYIDGRDGVARRAEIPTGSTVQRVRTVGAAAPGAVDSGDGEAPQVTTGVPVQEASGATIQPVMLAAHRRAVEDLGLDVDGVTPPDVAQAAARLRAGLPLTQDQAVALSRAVRAAAGTPGSPGARELHRAADALDRAAGNLTGRAAAGPPADLGDGNATLAAPGDLAAGDMVAFPVGDGPMLVGRVLRVEPRWGGRTWNVVVESEGRQVTRSLWTDEQVWRLPDLASPQPVVEPPETPDAQPADDAAEFARVRAAEVAETLAAQAAEAVLAAPTLHAARDAARMLSPRTRRTGRVPDRPVHCRHWVTGEQRQGAAAGQKAAETQLKPSGTRCCGSTRPNRGR